MEINTSDKLTDINTNLDEGFEPYFSDVFSPGETKEQLELGKQVVGESGGASSKSGYIRNFIADVNNETYTVSGLGFQPSSITGVCYNGVGNTHSSGCWNGTSQATIRNTVGGTQTAYDNEFLDGGASGYITVDSVNADGFVLKFSVSVSSTYNLIIWTANP